ncbi:DNA polymerase III subunit alpha [BD1-7 clade bacterium]|uniref:DNA polymerase III subunit alpha n=1 Tax=BD1-7 clade bacterium TaxID=2029982 RepID=A0A5S9QCW3_9GAMM|nr:DNA polymerase III subunit alpha [BD1-7 clade bacterium]CAA0119385.1 DNA polymerase III subunit alpha [BD1-7 clade bacterium]
MSEPTFVHLKVHSQFSLIDSLASVKSLVKNSHKLGMPAIALTDQANFFGLVKFYKAALGAGIKPIAGSDFIFRDELGDDCIITLIAMNDKGYKNITEIISLAYLKGQSHGIARVELEWVETYREGILALSGAKFGDAGKRMLSGKIDDARRCLERWKALFPDRFYVELQRTSRPGEETYLHEAVALAQSLDLPVVATNDVRFISSDDYEAHDARVCIHDGDVLDDAKRPRRYSDQQYLKSPEEMAELFSDIPSALGNTVEIAKRCNVQLHLGEYFLPEYPIPEGMSQDDFFRQLCRKGLDERLSFLFDTASDDFPAIEKEYADRLVFELDIILQMGFPGYFLIVMDFIQWAKDHDIPVGPGRGSGAGSLVAYALKITDIDPIKYDLLFERFLNPERVSMPDFDVDFCMEGRDRVIGYVADNYGRMAVSQIVTFGTMAAKAVVRDVARVLGKSYGVADKLSKLIPFEVGITLEKALDQEEALRDFVTNDSDAQEIWEMAIQLEGTIRGVGKHAGGVVIAPTKLTDFSALYCDEEGGGLVTQFDKGDVEDAGLVKFDFLGLRTLTIIDWAKATVDKIRAKTGEEPLDVEAIPLDDKITFDLLKRAETTAVFQLESRGMKELIKRLQPDNIEDMIALVALFRPGPLDSGMVDDFVNRKHGRAEVAYPDAKYQHDWLKPILEPTYGVIVYQEQVMQIAQVLAGYTLGGADLLRRAMGKKKPEEMAKQRDIFREGAVGQGIDPELAMKIFDLVEKFAGYGFNKSHSAAYAVVSYQTAWLKAHYPAPFMAAVMSSELQNTDKIVMLIEECRNMEMALVSPDVNCGEYMFTVNDDGAIVYGLGAIKGLGEGPIEALLQARNDGGPFKDLFDFCERVDSRKVNKRALEALIKAGAFDALGVSRWILMDAMLDAVQAAEQSAQNASAGITDLFGVVDDSEGADVYEEYRGAEEWTGKQRLTGEKDTLGLFFSGHPIDDYEDDLRQLKVKRLGRLIADKRFQLVAGMIVSTRYIKTKRGDKMAIITLDDRTGRIDATVFSKMLPDVEGKLISDEIILIRGEVENDDFSGGLRMRVDSILTMAEARSSAGRSIFLNCPQLQWPAVKSMFDECMFKALEQDHTDEEGNVSLPGCGVRIRYSTPQAGCDIQLAKHWRLEPDDDNITRLKRLLGEDNVRLQ